MRGARAWLLSGALACAQGCAARAPEIPEDRERAFLMSVERLEGGDHASAAAAAWAYLRGAGEDDPRYDRALRLLARSAEALGLRYPASVWWTQIARARRDAALTPEAVDGLRRAIEAGEHDEESVVTDFLAVEELPKLGGELDEFVRYTQGLHNLRQGLTAWGLAQLDAIHPDSPYRERARYALAVHQVARGELDAALAPLSALAEQARDPAVRQDALTAVARLAMQRGDYAAGLEAFERVREQVPDAPEVLLEVAWAHYYKGDPRRALGYLLALDAPAYGGLIAPERYILEALTLRSLCQFGPAREATARLRARYAQALADLYAGVPPERSAPLRAAAASRGALRPHERLARALERERAALNALAPRLGEGLLGALRALYARGAEAASARLEGALRRESAALARELLAAEEAVRLIAHELAVALLRGRQPPPGRAPVPPLDALATSAQVAFGFSGEFWTDELDELVVAAEDRCIDR
ncbi:MAG: tetratricopeptide repeat protein [Deltaproteobacteria bacterium]|nr:tetratricopeptide repeat protein [Deltaproteobacteria bacterium]